METAQFGHALLYLGLGVVFVLGLGQVSKLLAPNRPYPEKRTTYESGEAPLGSSWVRFNIRFYVMGLVFLVFDVEVVLLFPWAVVYAAPELVASIPNWGWFALAEASVFMAILLVGLAYVWHRGDLDWVRPLAQTPVADSPVPPTLYEAFNQAQTAKRRNQQASRPE